VIVSHGNDNFKVLFAGRLQSGSLTPSWRLIISFPLLSGQAPAATRWPRSDWARPPGPGTMIRRLNDSKIRNDIIHNKLRQFAISC
jgi:hypothetical protein